MSITSKPTPCCSRPALTLRSVEQILPGEWLYTLGYPNQEVRASLNKALLPRMGLPGSM